MNFEITEHVPGLTDEQVAALVAEAEAGYDLSSLTPEANPHLEHRDLVPDDLLEVIDKRAAEDGQSPETVVRRALTAYLGRI
ncbi:MAG: ribbon-helix-helix domain-containing protein [Dermatophilus congolensis]|nr:ribbon-helix-helix domain-containing protein [Dermatophilus congolensis]